MRALALSIVPLALVTMGCAQLVGADFDGAHGAAGSGGSGIPGFGGFGGGTFGQGGASGGSAGMPATNGVPTTCSDAAYEVGCCGPDGNVYYCSKGMLGTQTCAPGTCGFNATDGQYECNTNGGADPTGTHPAACGAEGSNAQTSCVATQMFARLADNGCDACVAQACADEAKSIDTCASDKAMCETQCNKDVACFCNCEVTRPNGCAALYRCIDIECRPSCK